MPDATRSTLNVTRYMSTRSPAATYSFKEAVTSGYAPDRGLFVPAGPLPLFSPSRLEELREMSFDDLAFAVLRRFIPPLEVPDSDLVSILSKCYSPFSSASRVEVVKPGSCPALISELFHGPTYCFKDLGLSVTCNLISHFTPPTSPAVKTLCVSTTGDTGPAAVAAVVSSSNPNLRIIAFYPRGQIR
jgi:threonine synthase